MDEYQDLLIDLANLAQGGGPSSTWIQDGVFNHYTIEELLQRRDELRLLWHAASRPIVPKESTSTGIRLPLSKTSRVLFMDWRTYAFDQPIEAYICECWLVEGGRQWLGGERTRKTDTLWAVTWESDRHEIHPRFDSLPTILAWACVRYAEHLAICQNLQCQNRYFLLRRHDQKYCSTECGNPSRKAARRKWWHEKGKRNRSRPDKRRN